MLELRLPGGRAESGVEGGFRQKPRLQHHFGHWQRRFAQQTLGVTHPMGVHVTGEIALPGAVDRLRQAARGDAQTPGSAGNCQLTVGEQGGALQQLIEPRQKRMVFVLSGDWRRNRHRRGGLAPGQQPRPPDHGDQNNRAAEHLRRPAD